MVLRAAALAESFKKIHNARLYCGRRREFSFEQHRCSGAECDCHDLRDRSLYGTDRVSSANIINSMLPEVLAGVRGYVGALRGEPYITSRRGSSISLFRTCGGRRGFLHRP